MVFRPPACYTRSMPKGFCILRVAKLKQAGGVAVALGHNTRERETVNADPELKKNNQVIGAESVEVGMAHFRDLIAQDKKPRKNAVLCLDYMISASNKSLDSAARSRYLNDALKWIRERHGAENVLQVAVHRDENTDAHMHVLVVPLVKNERGTKLNASRWLDGKAKLTQMQTEFAKEVGFKHDLTRGVEGSAAKHERVRRFYGLVNQPERELKIDIPKPPKFGVVYDLDHWKKGVEEMVFKQIQPGYEAFQARSRKLAIVERELESTKRSLWKLTDQNKTLQKENERLWSIVKEAPLENIRQFREEQAREQEKKRTLDRERGHGFSR